MNLTGRHRAFTLIALEILAGSCLPARADLPALQQAYGNDLSAWTNFPVPTTGGTVSDGSISINVALGAGSSFASNRITVTIPAGYQASHPNTFCRLKAVK